MMILGFQGSKLEKEILLFGAAASSATIGALSAGERNKKYYKMQIRIQLNRYINSNTNENRKYSFFSVLISKAK